MKQQIIIEWDNENQEKVVVYSKHIDIPLSEKDAMMLDFKIISEALVFMIHGLENADIQSSPASLRQAIKHLEDGFMDTRYNGLDNSSNYSTEI
jgi:hypothetical protein